MDLPIPVVLGLLGLEFAVFGWRVQREIALADQRRKTWLFVSDYANLMCMVLVLASCIIYPLAMSPAPAALPRFSAAVFAGAATVLIFSPVSMSAHYGLLPGQRGRPTMKVRRDDGTEGVDWKRCGRAELTLNIASWALAILAGLAVYFRP